MATRARRSPRRTEALSRERIIDTAVELLDRAGAAGLTFRALTERLATGPGAIYWHVANKDELLAAATEAVVAAVVSPASADSPEAAPGEIRAIALGLFEAIDDHPWLATQIAVQLSRNPQGTVTPRIFESIGRQVRALGAPEADWFTTTSVLVHYILGAAGQNAANARAAGLETDRTEYLGAASATWTELDAAEYPFLRAVAGQMREHDDRAQFLAGVELVLAGIAARR
ncbi:TetR/AcrR family transcriptional regulator [Nocardia sp. BMG111209]|uniref:TetR/AcrR family transcriptional regulator n=1 Tax=Nocardia sp. BMG111209 TaxID=1160137 RepID=UPI00035D09DB|nr:TetR/AcrR family transcriptional regulator [Nocardia sp. BMG111209]